MLRFNLKNLLGTNWYYHDEIPKKWLFKWKLGRALNFFLWPFKKEVWTTLAIFLLAVLTTSMFFFIIFMRTLMQYVEEEMRIREYTRYYY